MSQELEERATELGQRGRHLLRGYLAAGQTERQSMRDDVVALARELHSDAVGMCYHRATEFSPFIKYHFQLAAKLALVASWPDEAAIAPFEKEVFYYRNFEGAREMVEQYEKFKEEFIGG